MVYRCGDVYTGLWRRGRRHGRGCLAVADGSTVFVGCFEDDHRQGPGTVYKVRCWPTVHPHIGIQAALQLAGWLAPALRRQPLPSHPFLPDLLPPPAGAAGPEVSSRE